MLKNLKKSSIILTTHRMDEAEALCDTIVIMINGKFVCYGSPVHLKQNYGQGYQVIVRVKKVTSLDAVDSNIKQKLNYFIRQYDLQEIQNEDPALETQEIVYKVKINERDN